MLRVRQVKSAMAAKRYFAKEFERSDYWSDGEVCVGHWKGKLSQRLGVEGQEVSKKQFERMCDNLSPLEGQKLTPKTLKNRTVGYDLNFNAPKSVSVLGVVAGDERVIEAHRRAVERAMEVSEGEMSTRVRKGLEKNADGVRTTGNFCYAQFEHLEARPIEGTSDPHLHSHCFVFNATYDASEERIKAGQFKGVKENAPEAQRAYHEHLRQEIESLGYQTRNKGHSFEIRGISEDLINKFSRRRDLVERKREELGIEKEWKAADELGAKTRNHKQKDKSKDDLIQEMRFRLDRSETLQLQKVSGLKIDLNDEYREKRRQEQMKERELKLSRSGPSLSRGRSYPEMEIDF